jgi:predicted site-specific integrase-resolvase
MQTQSFPRGPRVYSVKRFAEAFDISDRTVWRLIADGKIKTIKLSLRRIGIPSEEAERYASCGHSA